MYKTYKPWLSVKLFSASSSNLREMTIVKLEIQEVPHQILLLHPSKNEMIKVHSLLRKLRFLLCLLPHLRSSISIRDLKPKVWSPVKICQIARANVMNRLWTIIWSLESMLTTRVLAHFRNPKGSAKHTNEMSSNQANIPRSFLKPWILQTSNR